MNPARRAEHATIHGVLNCYLRERGGHEIVSVAETPIEGNDGCAVRLPVPEHGGALFVELEYRSPTGRHLFESPATYLPADDQAREITLLPLVQLLIEEIRHSRDDPGDPDALVVDIVDSCKNVEEILEHRAEDVDSKAEERFSFRGTEQDVVFGHLFHPTPKSRDGMTSKEFLRFAPEVSASFQLHYFRADPDIVDQNSATNTDAAGQVEATLRPVERIDNQPLREALQSEDIVVPVHPWQSEYLRRQPHVQAHLGDNLVSLGPGGPTYAPTSSVRTLYSPESPYMIKSSLDVTITNSRRINKANELDRGVAIHELFSTAFGHELRERYPQFDVIHDPAYLTLDIGGGSESGFETILRENPFESHDGSGVAAVVSLCQAPLDADTSSLERLIRSLATEEGRTTTAVSEDWFRQYLEISVRPILWLYLAQGLGLEAHQQNSVVRLTDGYPSQFFYRDNQGYFLPESWCDRVETHLPDIDKRTGTVCSDKRADRGIAYYVILNNVFGLINEFGAANLVSESRLLELLRKEIERAERYDRDSSTLLSNLLTSKTLPAKANLLVRYHDIDELEASGDEDSILVDIENPLA